MYYEYIMKIFKPTVSDLLSFIANNYVQLYKNTVNTIETYFLGS